MQRRQQPRNSVAPFRQFLFLVRFSCPAGINLDYPAAAAAPGENSQPKDALNGHTTVVVVYGPLTLTTSHVTPPIGYRGNVEHLATLFQLPSGDFGLSNYINLCAFFPTPTSCVCLEFICEINILTGLISSQ